MQEAASQLNPLPNKNPPLGWAAVPLPNSQNSSAAALAAEPAAAARTELGASEVAAGGPSPEVCPPNPLAAPGAGATGAPGSDPPLKPPPAPDMLPAADEPESTGLDPSNEPVDTLAPASELKPSGLEPSGVTPSAFELSAIPVITSPAESETSSESTPSEPEPSGVASVAAPKSAAVSAAMSVGMSNEAPLPEPDDELSDPDDTVTSVASDTVTSPETPPEDDAPAPGSAELAPDGDPWPGGEDSAPAGEPAELEPVEPVASAKATVGIQAIAAPTPNTNASAPTRPTQLE